MGIDVEKISQLWNGTGARRHHATVCEQSAGSDGSHQCRLPRHVGACHHRTPAVQDDLAWNAKITEPVGANGRLHLPLRCKFRKLPILSSRLGGMGMCCHQHLRQRCRVNEGTQEGFHLLYKLLSLVVHVSLRLLRSTYVSCRGVEQPCGRKGLLHLPLSICGLLGCGRRVSEAKVPIILVENDEAIFAFLWTFAEALEQRSHDIFSTLLHLCIRFLHAWKSPREHPTKLFMRCVEVFHCLESLLVELQDLGQGRRDGSWQVRFLAQVRLQNAPREL
mmetsp:Transcript_24694/g.57357  ORF Transcript_24694/g.57357 Transcript_24694/m.57357 type:complete len:277 (-) Transcript_24694:1858-2688(-)